MRVTTSNCCPSFRWPCYYGNTEQTDTKTCELYWSDDGPATATIAADTIYSPNCQSEANAIADELALYAAGEATSCQEDCCWAAMCINIIPAEDAQYLDYWSLDYGIRFTQDVRICVTDLSLCGGFAGNTISFFPGFLSASYGGLPLGIRRAYGNPEFGSTCVDLEANKVYTFAVNDPNMPGPHPWNNNFPEKYSIGWDCENNCPPQAQSRTVQGFPFAIGYCQIEL